MSATVHIVDDDKSFRTAVGRLMEASGYRVMTYASSMEILASPPPLEDGCILLDLQMPGVDGFELQQALAKTAPLLPIVFLTGHGDIQASVRAMKAGAEDFIEKPASRAALLDAVERALLRFQERHAKHERKLALEALVSSLTARESQVFDLVVRGKRNKEIAFELGTSERTVKAHRRNIMEKLNVRSLAEAVSIAENLGLLQTARETPR